MTDDVELETLMAELFKVAHDGSDLVELVPIKPIQAEFLLKLISRSVLEAAA